MRIEHIAYMAEDPVEAAAWYCRHLGFTVKRSMADSPWTHFLADSAGATVLEIYNNAKCTVPPYRDWDPLLFHIAFTCPDLEAAMERLVAAGARHVSGPELLPSGDRLAMLRDPWGLALQLVSRSKPLGG
jgi:catechol 2,3-dioxygenase-like lactoylglutathione lyase family enzyme